MMGFQASGAAKNVKFIGPFVWLSVEVVRMPRNFPLVSIFCLLATMVLGTAAIAQSSERPESTVELLLADVCVEMTRGILLSKPEPDENQLMASQIFLEIALELLPKDAELWRLRRELALQRDNQQEARQALRTYCALRPNDDVAQSELIFDTLADRHTLDQRADLVQRILSNEQLAAKMTPALRSRLASYLAASAHELGDERMRKRWVQEAMRIDPTNHVAANMTYEMMMERGARPEDIAVALYGMIRANPVDPSTHERLAHMLMMNGAYEQAVAQFTVANHFSEGSGSDLFYYSYAFCLAANGQKDAALDVLILLDNLKLIELNAPKQQLTEQEDEDLFDEFDSDEEQQEPQQPEPVNVLSPEFELLRMVIKAGPHLSVDEPGHPLEGILEGLKSEVETGDDLAKEKYASLLVWFNRNPEESNKLLGELAQQRGENDPFVQRIRGWLDLHAGRDAQAHQTLKPLSSSDGFAAYALALLQKNPTERLRALRRTVRVQPDSLSALLAAQELMAAGETPPATSTGRNILDLMKDWPFALVQPDRDSIKRQWVMLDITIEPKRIFYLEPAVAEVRIRNLSEFPMAMGPDGPIPGQLMIDLVPRRGGVAVPRPAPIILDAYRRLRLNPHSELRLTVPLGRGNFGSFLRSIATERITLSATAILQPRLDPKSSRFRPGPLGTLETEALVQIGSPMPSVQRIDSWINSMNDPDRHQRARNLATLMRLFPMLIAGDGNQEFSDRITRGINDHMKDFDPVTQAWVVINLPKGPEFNDAFGPIHDVARRSDDHRVRIFYLSHHVSDMESPDLDAAQRHDDPRIAQYAKIHRAFLQEDQGEE